MSLDNSSDEDDSDVVKQSLMRLYADSPSEDSDDENHSNLHVLVLMPGNMLEEADIVMTEVNALSAQAIFAQHLLIRS